MYSFIPTFSWIVLISILAIRQRNSYKNRYVVLVLLLVLGKSIQVCSYILTGVSATVMGYKQGYKYLATGIFTRSMRFIHNFEKLPNNPTIYLVNYPVTVLEYALPSILPKPVCMVSSDRAKKLLSLAYEPENFLVFDSSKKNNYDNLKELIRERMKSISLYVYVDDMSKRIGDNHIGILRKGMFYIAKELGVTITPIAMDTIVTNMGIIPSQKFEVKVGETMKVDDPKAAIHKVRRFLLEEKRGFIQTKFTSI